MQVRHVHSSGTSVADLLREILALKHGHDNSHRVDKTHTQVRSINQGLTELLALKYGHDNNHE